MATRTNAKELLIAALNNDFLAEGFAEFLQTPLPEFDTAEMTVEEAIIQEGMLSRHLNAIFTSFAGLFPLEIPLRMGQKNATQQALLLASLQATRSVGNYYLDDAKAAAEAINAKMEEITPDDGTVEIPVNVLQELSAAAAGLVGVLKQQSEESVTTLLDMAESFALGVVELAGETAEGAVDISASVLRGLRSISRSLVNALSGEE